MDRDHQKRYVSPYTLQAAPVLLERDLVVGSPEITVAIAGHGIGDFFEVEETGSTFNQIWD